jgi:hypothetical protein
MGKRLMGNHTLNGSGLNGPWAGNTITNSRSIDILNLLGYSPNKDYSIYINGLILTTKVLDDEKVSSALMQALL